MTDETVNAGADTVDAVASTPAPTTAGSLLAGSAAETTAAETTAATGGQVDQTEGEKLLAGKYKTPDELEKAYKNLESKIGAKGIIPPGENASAEEIEAFHRQLGKPESADAYEIAVPEGMQADEGLMSWFKETAHKNNMSKGQAETFAQEYHEYFAKRNAELVAEQLESATKELRAEYGAKFEANINGAFSALKNLVGEKEATRIGQQYGRDAGFVRALVNVHKLTGEDTVTDKTASNSGIDAKGEYNAILKDKSHKLNAAYWNGNHPMHADAVAEVRKLASMIHGDK